MIGHIQAIYEDKKQVLISFDIQPAFKQFQPVNVQRAKKWRTGQQNGLYFAFLSWCIHIKGGRLSETAGRFDVLGLHEDVKIWYRSKWPECCNADFSTAEMSRMEYSEFVQRVDYEFFVSKCGIDTSPFWSEYDNFKAWLEFNPGCTFKMYMDSK